MLGIIPLLIVGVGFALWPQADRWHYQQQTGLICISLYTAWALWKKIHPSVGVAFALPVIYGILQYGFSAFVFGSLGPLGQSQWGSNVAGAVIPLLIFAGFILNLPKEYLNGALDFLYAIAIVDSAVVILRWLFEGHGFAWWVMFHPSVEASFLACFLPIAFNEQKNMRWPLFLLVPAILCGYSSTGCASIGVALASYWLAKRKKRAVLPILVLIPMVSAGSWLVLRGKLLNSDGRFHVWQTMMKFWSETFNPIIGAGPGSFFMYGPSMQIVLNGGEPKPGDQLFFWLHNDWLQVLFEGGALGLLSVIVLYGFMLKRSFRRPVIFSSVCVYGFMALTQFPLRVFFMQLLGAILIYESFREFSEETKTFPIAQQPSLE